MGELVLAPEPKSEQLVKEEEDEELMKLQ